MAGDPFKRIKRLEALYEGGEQVGWQAQDTDGKNLMKLTVDAGNQIRKSGRPLTIIRDKRQHLQQRTRKLSLMQMLVEAAGGFPIEVILINGKCYDFEQARDIIEAPPPPPNPTGEFMVWEAPPGPYGIPTLDNWLGFERAWAEDTVLCKGSMNGRPHIVVVPRHPPDWPHY